MSRALPAHWRSDVRLAELTTWRVGGAAALYTAPTSVADLLRDLEAAHERALPVTFLGRGSNVLVPDGGVAGLVVALRSGPQDVALLRDGERLRAQWACALPRLARAALEAGRSGFEFLVGIPGTVGAGVAINAGIGGRRGLCVRDVLVSAEILDVDTGDISSVTAADLGLAYRSSAITPGRSLVLAATFMCGAPTAPGTLHERHRQHLARRAHLQPIGASTCGSVFKQPEGGEAAGWYLERAGCKDLRVGRAQVSRQHANWIVNEGGAAAAEIEELIARARHRVAEHFGVLLELEVVRLGASVGAPV